MRKTNKTFTTKSVSQMAAAAHIPCSPAQQKALATAFTETVEVVANVYDILQEKQASETPPLNQISGLSNIMREDVVVKTDMFSQDEALANAPATHDGFFLVDRILEEAAE